MGVPALSRVRPPHLICRGGTFYIRVRVPRDIVDQVGLVEIRRSLHVARLSEARLLGPVYSARIKDTFRMIRTDNLERADAIIMMRRCFADLEQEIGAGYQPITNFPSMEIMAQEAGSEDELYCLTREIESRQFSPSTVARAKLCAGRAGVRFPPQDDPAYPGILLGVVRALAESERLFQFRLREGLHPYQPHDRLLASPVECPPQTEARHLKSAVPIRLGPSVEELAARYLQARKARWTAKTYRTNRVKVQFIVDHLGASFAAAAITPQEIREYRDAVLRLRSNHHVGAGKGFYARQTEAAGHRIQPKTATLIFETCKAMFRWAKAEGYIDSNPAQDIVLDLPKTQKGRKPLHETVLRRWMMQFGTQARGTPRRSNTQAAPPSPSDLVAEDARPRRENGQLRMDPTGPPVPSRRRLQVRSGLPISPAYPPAKVGCIWPQASTCTPARSSAGRCARPCTPRSRWMP